MANPRTLAVPTPIWGLKIPGNIDLYSRPIYRHPDGTISTVRSITVGTTDGRQLLLPTISPDGRLLSNDDAIAMYNKTGQHLGVFDTPMSAEAYARVLHLQQQKLYAK